MQNTLPRGIVASEIDGIWSKDSGAYYNSITIQNSRSPDSTYMTGRQLGNSVFIAGFDVARGGMDENKTDGDDFALTILELDTDNLIAKQVLTVRKNKIDAAGMAGIVHKYDKLFGFSMIVYDPGGGGLFVRDELRKENQSIDGNPVYSTPIISITDGSGIVGNQILVSFSRADYYLSKLWAGLQSDSVLINAAHTELKGALEHKRLILSPPWGGWDGNEAAWDADAKRAWLNRTTNLTPEDRARAEMDLCVAQLSLIDFQRDKDQVPKVDSFGMYKFTSKDKKDSAYSLFYAYTGVLIFTRLPFFGMATEKRGDKRRIVFAASEI